ncbi:hypothetical protein QCA50_009891 [Cerrena zonata]|uniref:RRM domain-containing protein n=1 Tax=Cerrena zonata TaxID=2478898 RepID=A0AAW0G1A5_9APHY
MDLGSFLADEQFGGGGSWADEDVDMSSIGVQVNSSVGVPSAAGSFASRERNEDSGFERRREEYPVPDAPPYRARVNNLPYDITEGSLIRYFEDKLVAPGTVTDAKVPTDMSTGRAKGFAFITFQERELLEDALKLTLSEFNGRKIFVNVAAPQKQDVFDMDWTSVRGSGMPARGERSQREEAELDWGSARGSGIAPRQRSNRGEGRPRREEPDLDWGSARNTASTLPPRERSNRRESLDRPPRKEEPEFDWGSARSTTTNLPPRERSNRGGDRPERRPRKEEPEFDWGSARSTTTKLPPRERSNRTEKKDDLDWKRGQALEPRQKPNRTANDKKGKQDKEAEKPQGPQKSLYDVLAVEGDSDEEESKPEVTKPEAPKQETGLEEATSKLSVQEESKTDDGWEVVAL